jgi:hypothetical protein
LKVTGKEITGVYHMTTTGTVIGSGISARKSGVVTTIATNAGRIT